MAFRPIVTAFLMTLVLVFFGNGPVSAQTGAEGYMAAPRDASEIPKEPGWKDPTYRGWELISIPGLIATYYDLDQDGHLDYSVTRKMIRKVSSEEVTLKKAIEIARFDKLSIYISNPVIYFTNQNPLFYCIGLDFRKNCRNIWVDIAEDGLNGNETRYTLSTPSLPMQ